MNSEEVREVYSDLADALNSAGLSWVVGQVEGKIQAGHAVEKETRIFKDNESESETTAFWEEEFAPRRPGKPTLMMALEPWPDADQLLFLIDALRHALVYAAEIENEGLRLLSTFAPVESVRFESETGDAAPVVRRFTGVHDERLESLAELLNALEREVRA